MSYKSVFRRYEIKYLITPEQKERILEAMNPYMKLDNYGRTTIRNVYLDTDNYRLIRRSIEKPKYKEKIRIRSYAHASLDDKVFVELKKKYQGVVYKRRVAMPQRDAFAWLTGEKKCPLDGQIIDEIDYFARFYGKLNPAVFLSYEREAYFLLAGGDFRVTFDDNILVRQDNVSLDAEIYGRPILPEGKIMMEIKCPGAIPLWMVEVLSREKIYKTSFSKYGTAYREYIFPETVDDNFKNKLKEAELCL